LGEICSALEKVWGRHTPSKKVVQGAYKNEYGSEEAENEFKKAVDTIARFAKEEGRQPRLLIGKLGQDGHDRGAAVIASGFAGPLVLWRLEQLTGECQSTDMGFDVDVSPLFSTPEECAQAAVDADVHVVGVSSQAAGHKTLVPAIVNALKVTARPFRTLALRTPV
jgi:methylmalonyl-CoA mutase